MADSAELQFELHEDGPVVTLVVAGALDAGTASTVKEAIDDALRLDPMHIVVDLADVPFMDSSGLGMLVGGSIRARRRDITFVLRAPRPNVQRVLRTTGLASLFGVDA